MNQYCVYGISKNVNKQRIVCVRIHGSKVYKTPKGLLHVLHHHDF